MPSPIQVNRPNLYKNIETVTILLGAFRLGKTYYGCHLFMGLFFVLCDYCDVSSIWPSLSAGGLGGIAWPICVLQECCVGRRHT